MTDMQKPPSPLQIKLLTARIRQNWSAEERASRLRIDWRRMEYQVPVYPERYLIPEEKPVTP